MHKTQIFRANKNDIAKISIARQLLWPHADVITHTNELLEMFERDDFLVWYTETTNAEIIGFAECMIKPHANGCNFSPVLFLEGVWVHPHFRRQNIASKLLEACKEFAIENEIKGLASDSLVENKISYKAHKKWGFEEKERVVCFGMRL